MISWDALTAIGSLVSAGVVLVGGTVAVYQLRESVRFVMNDWDERMRDPEYAAELTRSRGWETDPGRHPELVVLARLEETGIYLRHRLLLGNALLDFDAVLIMQSWEKLVGVVELMRTWHRNPRVWSNAEFLYTRALAFRSGDSPARPRSRPFPSC